MKYKLPKKKILICQECDHFEEGTRRGNKYFYKRINVLKPVTSVIGIQNEQMKSAI